MKKVSIVLSGLAVAATVSTAMAHTKSTANLYCLAQEENAAGNLTLVTFDGSATAPCGTVITRGITINSAPNPFTFYGYVKTTPAGQRCQIAACPAIRATQEPL